MKIILISGKAGSGKTSLAEEIKKQLPKTVVTNFSKYIKLFAMEMTDWDGNDINKPRTFLQEMGDTLRSININYLTDRLYNDMKVYEKYYDYVIISDVRLINEIEYFKDKEYPVVTIRIVNNDNRRHLDNDQMSHCTEIELDNYDKFDLVIEDNNININEVVEGLK